jgi:hypothetical protein
MRKGGLIILIAAVCFGAYVFYTLLGVEPVKVTHSKLVRSGNEVSVQGELRNTGEDVGALELEIRYFDRGGRSLGRDTVSVGELKNGARITFRSPPRQMAAVAEYSIYLNHGRNAYGN